MHTRRGRGFYAYVTIIENPTNTEFSGKLTWSLLDSAAIPCIPKRFLMVILSYLEINSNET